MMESDDLRQVSVVMMNEIRKFVRSKIFLIYVGLVTLAFLLLTLLPYIVGDGLQGSAGDIFATYSPFVSIVVVLASTLFASNTIVSEFEERTALILFTRPLKRTVVFAGKFLACFVLESVVVLAYYLVASLVSLAVAGDVVSSLYLSVVMALAYVFATSGIAVLISSVMKKSGTSAVVTFVGIMLIVPVISMALTSAGSDPWYMLDLLSNSITTSVPDYVDAYNQQMVDMGEMMGIDVSAFLTEVADTVKSGLAMIAWGLVSTVLAWIIFLKREF